MCNLIDIVCHTHNRLPYFFQFLMVVFQIDSIIQTSKKLGMITMDDAILDLLIKGEISTETALSFAQDRTTFERKINII